MWILACLRKLAPMVMLLSCAAMWESPSVPYYYSHVERTEQDARSLEESEMHELVERIKKPELCYVFARNAERRGHPELALQAYRRAVDLRAQQHETGTEAEFAAVRAIYAYEEALSYSRGKRTRATGTWQLVNRHGLLPALSKRIASRNGDDVNAILKELGMDDYSFEAVQQSYPDALEAAA